MSCKECTLFEFCVAKAKIKDPSKCKFINHDEESSREYLIALLDNKFENHILIKMPSDLACALARLIKNLKQ